MRRINRQKDFAFAAFSHQADQLLKRRHFLNRIAVVINAVKVRYGKFYVCGQLFQALGVGCFAKIGAAVDFHVAAVIDGRVWRPDDKAETVKAGMGRRHHLNFQ